MMTEAKKIPQLYPTCVLFPYGKMGQSAAGFDCDLSGGKFGPFEKQLFVGDQTHSTVMRVTLEKVNGHYQGACYPFKQGFGSGNVPVRFGKDGSLFVGGTNRGWGSRGTKPFAIERLVWTGKSPFEVKEMKAKPDGFELTFTKPVDAGDGRQGRVVRDEDVHVHLPGRLRQPGGGPDDAEDHEGRGRQGRQERAADRGRACRRGTSTTWRCPASARPTASRCCTRRRTTRSTTSRRSSRLRRAGPAARPATHHLSRHVTTPQTPH